MPSSGEGGLRGRGISSTEKGGKAKSMNRDVGKQVDFVVERRAVPT